MQQRGRYKAARVIVEERLKSGEAIHPEELADLLEMTVPEVAARRLWLRTYVGRLVHDTARDMGVVALSLGPGQGFKVVETPDEMDLAKARTQAQVKGQATRGRRLKEKLAMLN